MSFFYAIICSKICFSYQKGNILRACSCNSNFLPFVIVRPRIIKTKVLHFITILPLFIRFCFLESTHNTTHHEKPGTKRLTKERPQHIWPRIQFFPRNNSRNFCRSVSVHSLLYRLRRSQVSATKTTKRGGSWFGRGRKRSLENLFM